MPLKRDPAENICSRRGCNNPPTMKVVWKNPAVRGNRNKVWLSCADHEQYFRDYFSYRSFPVQFIPWDERDD